jgi:hypothetical protein
MQFQSNLRESLAQLLPYTALRDAVLTHPTLVEGLILLFSSAASAHNVVETGRAQISAA